MDVLHIQIERLSGNDDLPFPAYMTDKAAGMDIYAAVQEDIKLSSGERFMVPTGFAVSIPEGYEAQIRPRSGLAFKNGITLINAPGTIDADYRGEIKILLVNLGQESFIIRRGDRIAQMTLHQVCKVEWEACNQLDTTKRGHGGFGHTG